MPNPRPQQPQRPAPVQRPRHLYVLVHKHQKGVHVVPFWYEASKQFPWPDTATIVKAMKLNFDPDLGETVQLEEIPPKDLPVASWDKGHGGYAGFLCAGLPPAERDEAADAALAAAAQRSAGELTAKDVADGVADLEAGRVQGPFVTKSEA
jgi:hypothetical protein